MESFDDLFKQFPGSDRFAFPGNVKRVSAGSGGETLLITGSEKIAILDCGMAFAAGRLIENLKHELNGRAPDYLLISHTHYDHIGALPFVRREWPDIITAGAKHAAKVFANPKAIKTINALGENAGILYEGAVKYEVPEEGFSIDRIIGDGDRIVLGEEEIAVLETGGHTDCSLTFVLEPCGIMFLSESTGVLEGPDSVHVTILKSFRDSMASVEKCRAYGAKYLVSSHYGMMPEYYNEKYWESFLSTTDDYKEFLFGLFERGLLYDEIMEKYAERYWDDRRKKEQPKEAFILNAQNVVKVFLKEYELIKEKGNQGA